MTMPLGRQSQTLASMTRTFTRLGAQLQEMGMTLSVWDDCGRCVWQAQPATRFCDVVCGSARDASLREVALRVIRDDAPAQARGALGCCIIGVPVRHRRRLAGAAVASFPVREMLDEEALARLCQQKELDRQVVWAYAMSACCLPGGVADCMTRVLGQLLRSEHAAQVAKEELATLSANLATTYEELSLLYRISGSMRVTQPPREFLQEVCGELLEVMTVSVAAAVVRAHPPGSSRDFVVHAGTGGPDGAGIRALADRRLLPGFAKERRAVVDNHFTPGDQGGDARNLIAVPLVNEDRVIGTLMALGKRLGEFDSVDLKLISSIANQVASFLANNRLYADLQDLLMGVLHALTATIDAKDPYTCGHSQRVALVSRRLAEEMSFSPERAHRAYLSGLLHDIGKIGIPETILRKDGRLTDAEYDDMKRHPALAAKILGGIRQLDEMMAGILHHHERLDGKGYPGGLHGEEVTIEGRIVCLADCFDAMTSDRTYRKALPLETVIQEIRRHAGTQFDPKLVDVFLSLDLAELLREIHQPVRGLFPLAFRQDRNQ